MKMRHLREKILMAFMVFLMFNQSLWANKTLSEISKEMNLSQKETVRVLNGANLILEEVKHKFTRIADSDVTYRYKVGSSGLINDTLSIFTKGKWATIQTSSIHRSSINTTYLDNYLEKLAYMSQDSKNISVSLDFGEKMFFKDIRRTANAINVDVDIFQFFRKCKDIGDGVSCYSDITEKTFALNIRKKRGNYFFSIDSVRVKDTMRVNSKSGKYAQKNGGFSSNIIFK
jgi:hypothetical protein